MTKAVPTKRININVPVDVQQWLQARAAYNGASLSSEVVRSLRARMEAEAEAKARKSAIAAE